jgi:hypothetical protein
VPVLIQFPGSEEAMAALAQFKAYAAGTLLVLDLVGTFVFALSGGAAGVRTYGRERAMNGNKNPPSSASNCRKKVEPEILGCSYPVQKSFCSI